ncbi:MAG: NifB/NifX family molybdenum-iron cluster-binding protein [Candidatus Methanomethylophilaceae archaeon]|jgi:predicted Fe-Mo cluster-binding NifX family protein|nr:NifB/NifX family molybdenum-iron cluster-binding protein [Candidatus Methanomethylophilaceae archaeon]NLF33566.1 dinitrogenase iron-molybdenum cofactor [Thermoplasmatales archaeon]
MKIAIACEGENVSEHFGHCGTYRIYNVEDGRVTDYRIIRNPGHRPGFLPVFLKEEGADVVISGGMGESAIILFENQGMDVVVGASGDAGKAALAYLEGVLRTTGAVCREHLHHDECGH